MHTARPSLPSRTIRTASPPRALLYLALLACAAPNLLPQRIAVHTQALRTLTAEGATDAGQLPVSQPLTLTVRLRPSAEQAAALDQMLAAQIDPASDSYHQWLTPEEYASRFGASNEQIASLTTWLGSRGLDVVAVSPARTRLTITGNAGQAELAFATTLHQFRLRSRDFFANTTEPSLPTEVSAMIAGISGLDDLPLSASGRIALASASAAATRRLTNSSAGSAPLESIPEPDPLAAIAAAIDLNASPVLSLTTTACTSDLTEADVDAYRALFRQASAQGVTVLAASSCHEAASDSVRVASSGHGAAGASFPGALAEVTSLTLSPRETSISTDGIVSRPIWQAAPGLPADALRHEPDLTTSSAAAFARAITTLNQQMGSRLGNINATLYALAKTPGLFTQPDASLATSTLGTWEPASGLGVIDLKTLLKVYPRTSGITTKTSLISSTYAVNYGNPFTLTSNVQVTGVIPPVTPTSPYPPAPTGIVTFTASTQGVLGTSGIDAGGTATLDSGVLPVGTYVLVASYSGDAYYAPSSSTSNVTITVSLVNAKLAATISPSTSIPYGAAATITATVTLPGSSAAPTGPVSAQISSGAPVSATLSPNPGSNSATANIAVSVPPPGSYNVQVTCAGTTNFQCQAPVNIPITTVKGYTNTTISVTPAAPQAGQPISLTATVVNSGNGTGTYTYGGSISFYDSGKLIATAPVATNQATTTTTLSGTRTHNITAVYTGDSNWNTSTSDAVAVLPTILPDELTLSTNVNGQSSLSGLNIIFTGSVSTTITYQSGPSGTITFFDTFNNSVVQLGNPSAIVANGPYASIGIFTTTGLLPGIHHIYAQYSGDDNYAAAISPVITLSLSDFNVTMTPLTLTLDQGKSAEVTAIVGASGGFSGTVSLGCTPPGSSEATCNISPSSVAIGQTTTITITTAAPRAARSGHQARLLPDWKSTGGASFAVLLLFAFVPRRRSRSALLILLVGISLTAAVGCGLQTTTNPAPPSPPGSTPSDPGTPLGTQNYTVTAAGSDGVNTVRHTYAYQVTVQ